MQHLLFSEKYRPKTIEETILPSHIKTVLQKFVDDKNIPNLLFASANPGTGKTSAALAMLDEIGADYIKINASKDGQIDTLRTTISNFASTVSLSGTGRKYVLLDEADHLTHHFQPALRGFIDDFSQACGFILTCNYRQRLLEPIQSRFSVLEFAIPEDEKKGLMIQYGKRLLYILEQEKIKFEPKVLGPLIQKFFPDFRKLLNEVQVYTASGALDEGILAFAHDDIGTLLPLVQARKIKDIRDWFSQRPDLEAGHFYTDVYNKFYDYVLPDSIPEFVLLLSEYQYRAAFAMSQEINNFAFILAVLSKCNLKK